MTLLIRSTFPFGQEWRVGLPPYAEATEQPAVPAWALATFVPSVADRGQLSLYELDEEAGAKAVAAAMGMRAGGVEEYQFIAISRDVVEASGLAIASSRGDTGHHVVDGMHRHLDIEDAEAAVEVARAFLGGDLLTVRKNIVQAALERAVRRDEFDIHRLAVEKSLPARDKIWNYVKTGAVEVRGIPEIA